MLKINTNMKLKCLNPLVTGSENMYEKMKGNYEMLGTSFKNEELLHMVMSPPEIYLGEGGLTSIVTDTKIANYQQVKVDVVNNLLNRILLYGTNDFHYQDTVYISYMLQKLGITNTEVFMKQVALLQEENKNTTKLIKLYQENMQTLQTVTEQGGKTKAEKKEASEQSEEEGKTELHLHEAIYKRLKTSQIYQELNRLYQSIPGQHNLITKNEYTLAEQNKFVSQFTLNEIRNQIQEEERPVLYHRTNVYEEGTLLMGDVTKEEYMENITAAVLLNLADNFYQLRKQNLMNEQYTWLDFSPAFYESAENTLARIEQYHESRTAAVFDYRDYITNLNQSRSEEVQIIEKMIQTAQMYNSTYKEEESSTEINEKTDTKNIYYDQSKVSESALTQLNNQLNQLNQRNEQIELNVKNGDEVQFTNIKEQLDLINSQNIAHYEQIRQGFKEAGGTEKILVDREKAKADALRALEHPEELLQEYMTQVSPVERIENIQEKNISNLMSNETKEIFRLVREYQENPERMKQEGKVRQGNMEVLSEDMKKLTEKERHLYLEHVERTIENQAETIIEETVKQPAEKFIRKNEEVRETLSQVEMIHKQVESSFDTELLEEIAEHNRLLNERLETKETVETVEEHKILNVNNVQNTMEAPAKENIDSLVRMGIDEQMNRISERVYSQLEKKLGSERKRRGY